MNNAVKKFGYFSN